MSTPPAADDDQFVELIAAFDEALAGGRAEDFLARTPPPPQLADRLQRAQACLRRLTDALAGHAGNQPVRVGRFQIERELGRGGFGVVYLAFDPVLKRQVALKVPRLETLATVEVRQRFLREAELTASLDHPNIVPVYEAGHAGAVGYIASAYCPGPDLSRWQAEQAGPLPPRTAAALVRTLAEALAYCHQRGILHRDLKPSNVMLMPLADKPEDPDALPFVPRLTDFGLAKLMESNLSVTGSSVVLGTPLYMAPEQAEGRSTEIGPATDIYGLGVILHELLEGRPPFQGSNVLSVMDQIRAAEPEPLATAPAALGIICLKCLRKEPAERYATALNLAEDLHRFLAGKSILAKPTGLWHRLRAWSRRPARIGEAGIVALLIGAVALLPCSIGIMGVMRGIVPVDDPGQAVQGLTLVILFFALPHFWLGWRTLARKGYAIRIGLVAPPIFMAYGTLQTFGFMDSGEFFSDAVPSLQLLTEGTGLTFLLGEWLMYFVAWQAWRFPSG